MAVEMSDDASSSSRLASQDHIATSSSSSSHDKKSSQGQYKLKTTPALPALQNIDSTNLDKTWEEIISARIPSEYSRVATDRSFWQQVADSLQAMVDEDDTAAQARGRASSSSLLPSLAAASFSSPSSPRDFRQVIPSLSYPQSGERPVGSTSEEAASSRALEQAGKMAFSGSKVKGKQRSLGKQRQQQQQVVSAGRKSSSQGQSGSEASPIWLNQIGSSILPLEQISFEGDPDPVPPATPSDTPWPTRPSEGGPITRRPIRNNPNDTRADLMMILIPLLVLVSTLLLIMLMFLFLFIIMRRRARIALLNSDGPLDVGREEELEGHGGLDGIEERWLETQDESTRRGYARAKDWLLSHPPASTPSEITMSQFLSIQEKGVSAWSFEPDYEANSSCYVEARTEITFVADGEGMAPQEGGGCSVQSNLPLPKINEVYYWEAKMFTKPESTGVAVGLATKPYPSFRLPGWSKYSVGFFSQDGFKCHNYPFAAQSYGPAYVQGDVIGVGYRPRTGTAFFTRNGKKLEDAFVGLHRYNLFPTIGADGPAEVHVNLGQAGFVFIEANVKKLGLAPMNGTLAPPPAYGQERGSILIETAGQSSSGIHEFGGRRTPPPPPTPPNEERDRSSSRRRRRDRRRQRETINAASHQAGVMAAQERQSPLPVPTRGRRISSGSSADAPINPPTPGHLDISLHSMHHLDRSGGSSRQLEAGTTRSGSDDSYFPDSPSRRDNPSTDGRFLDLPRPGSSATTPLRSNSPSPPPYQELHFARVPPLTISPSSRTSTNNGSLGGTSESNHQARRGSGRSHRLAEAVFGVLSERGLIRPEAQREVSTTGGSEYERLAGGSGPASPEQEERTWGETLSNWWSGGRG